MPDEGQVDAAVTAFRDAVVDYRAGLLDDRDLRMALAEATVDTPGVLLDRLVQAALALPAFTDDALSQLHRAINRLSSDSLHRGIP